MEYRLNKFMINVPDEVLLADLRETALRLGRNYISHKEYNREGKYNASTFTRRFGGWNPALIKAGLQIKRLRCIPHDMLMRNLKHVWDSLGRQPRYLEMIKPLSVYNVTIYTSRYGSWNKALEQFIKWQAEGKSKKAKMAPVKDTDVRKLKKLTKHIGKGMRYDILKRDNFKCRLCGASPATNPKTILHIDHIKPRAKGGETTPANLQTLCSDCNLGKAAKSD